MYSHFGFMNHLSFEIFFIAIFGSVQSPYLLPIFFRNRTDHIVPMIYGSLFSSITFSIIILAKISFLLLHSASILALGCQNLRSHPQYGVDAVYEHVPVHLCIYTCPIAHKRASIANYLNRVLKLSFVKMGQHHSQLAHYTRI